MYQKTVFSFVLALSVLLCSWSLAADESHDLGSANASSWQVHNAGATRSPSKVGGFSPYPTFIEGQSPKRTPDAVHAQQCANPDTCNDTKLQHGHGQQPAGSAAAMAQPGGASPPVLSSSAPVQQQQQQQQATEPQQEIGKQSPQQQQTLQQSQTAPGTTEPLQQQQPTESEVVQHQVSATPAATPATAPEPATKPVHPTTVRRLLNLAELSDGASVLAANPEAKKPERAIDKDIDSFMKNDCNAEKWMIIELSQLGTVETVKLTMKELYSSRVHTFRVLGRSSHPRKDGPDLTASLGSDAWQLLGSFTAENKRGTQSFSLPQRSRVRYLLLMFDTHYGSEIMCAMNWIEVLGMSAAQELEEALALQELEGEADEDDLLFQQQQLLPQLQQQVQQPQQQSQQHPQAQQGQQLVEAPNISSMDATAGASSNNSAAGAVPVPAPVAGAPASQAPPQQLQEVPSQALSSHPAPQQDQQSQQQVQQPQQGQQMPQQPQTVQQQVETPSQQQVGAEAASQPTGLCETPAPSSQVEEGTAASVGIPATGSAPGGSAVTSSTTQQQQGQHIATPESGNAHARETPGSESQQHLQGTNPASEANAGAETVVSQQPQQHQPELAATHVASVQQLAAGGDSSSQQAPEQQLSAPATDQALPAHAGENAVDIIATYVDASSGTATPSGVMASSGPPLQGNDSIRPQHAQAAAAGGATLQHTVGGSGVAPATAVTEPPAAAVPRLDSSDATVVGEVPSVATPPPVAMSTESAIAPGTQSEPKPAGAQLASPIPAVPAPVGQQQVPAGAAVPTLQPVSAGTNSQPQPHQLQQREREPSSGLDSWGHSSATKPKQAGNLFDVIKSEIMQLKLDQGKVSKKLDSLAKRSTDFEAVAATLQQQQAALIAQLANLAEKLDLVVQRQEKLEKLQEFQFGTHQPPGMEAPAAGAGVLHQHIHQLHVNTGSTAHEHGSAGGSIPQCDSQSGHSRLLLQPQYQWGIVMALSITSVLGQCLRLHPEYAAQLPAGLRLVVCVLAVLNGIIAALLSIWLLVLQSLFMAPVVQVSSESPVLLVPTHRMLGNGSAWDPQQ